MTSPSLIHYHPSAQDKADTLKVIDALRAAVESGECVAFACVAIAPDDAVRSTAARPCTSAACAPWAPLPTWVHACMHAGEI